MSRTFKQWNHLWATHRARFPSMDIDICRSAPRSSPGDKVEIRLRRYADNFYSFGLKIFGQEGQPAVIYARQGALDLRRVKEADRIILGVFGRLFKTVGEDAIEWVHLVTLVEVLVRYIPDSDIDALSNVSFQHNETLGAHVVFSMSAGLDAIVRAGLLYPNGAIVSNTWDLPETGVIRVSWSPSHVDKRCTLDFLESTVVTPAVIHGPYDDLGAMIRLDLLSKSVTRTAAKSNPIVTKTLIAEFDKIRKSMLLPSEETSWEEETRLAVREQESGIHAFNQLQKFIGRLENIRLRSDVTRSDLLTIRNIVQLISNIPFKNWMAKASSMENLLEELAEVVAVNQGAPAPDYFQRLRDALSELIPTP